MKGLRKILLITIAIFLLTGLVLYAHVFFYPFVHDDLVFIRHNPGIASFDGWRDFFVKADSHGIRNLYYRPVLDLVYRLEYRMFGFHAPGYHVFNVVIHIVNAIFIFLIFFLGMRVSQGRPLTISGPLPGAGEKSAIIAAATALLFLAHPVQTEAVACIAGISNLAFSFFCLLSLLLYLFFRAGGLSSLGGGLCLSGSLLCYGLALLTKEQVIFLPFMAGLWEILIFMPASARSNNKTEGRHLFEAGMAMVAFVGVTLAYVVWRTLLSGTTVTGFLKYKGELALRIAAIPLTLLMDARILAWPFDLHYYRSIDILHAPGWALGVLLAGILAMALVLYRLPAAKRSWALLGIGWFLITLLPVLNIVPLIHEYSWIATFEHFLYLPAAGLFLFAAVTGDHVLAVLFKEKSKKVGLLFLAGLVVFFGSLTIQQNTFWRGEIPLFERAVMFEPNLGRLRYLLGIAYAADGRHDQALDEFERASGIMEGYLRRVRAPEARGFYVTFLKSIYSRWAHIELRRGDFASAASRYRRMLELAPRDADAHKNFGVVLMRMGQWDQAARHFEDVLALRPRDIDTMNTLAVCRIEQGQWDQAEALLREALAIDGGFIRARGNLDHLLRLKLTSEERPGS